MQRGAVHPHSCSATASMVPDWSEPDPSASHFFFSMQPKHATEVLMSCKVVSSSLEQQLQQIDGYIVFHHGLLSRSTLILQ